MWIKRLKWAKKSTAKVIDFLVPPPTSTAQRDTHSEARTFQQQRPKSWHSSAETLVFPKIDLPAPPQLTRTQPPTLIKTQTFFEPIFHEPLTRRQTNPTVRSSGEFNSAARHRARNQLSRKNSRPKRHRRHSSACDDQFSQPTSATDVKDHKKQNRQSAPLLSMPPVRSTMSANDLIRITESKRRSPLLPLQLPAIPVSPNGPLFRDLWLEDCTTSINEHRKRALNLLVSPKTRVAKPALLSSVPLKCIPTAAVSTKNARRNKQRDVSHFPASAKWYFWQLYVDGCASRVISAIQVQRKPSRGHHQQRESIEWGEQMLGQRKFNRHSGYWT